MNKKYDVNIIVAVDREGGFGREGKIPWYFKEDFENFKRVTQGSVCIMGRKTYDDMLDMREKKGRSAEDSVLPGRKCYVMSRTPQNFKGATHTHSITNVLRKHEKEKIFVLGGEKIYQESLSWAEKVYTTVIDDTYECDRFFPINILEKKFKIVSGDRVNSGGTQLYFLEYQRK